jgi:bacillithiol biosynthesis cysteine-adding enzyme BshC
MDCRALTFRELPHQPKLFLDYVDAFPKVSRFFAYPPTLANISTAARELDYPAERRAQVAGILRRQNQSFGSGEPTLRNIERLANGAVAVLTGQQVGLFSGPAYAIYKALTAVEIAGEMTAQGIDAVPLFWMATEDHDLDEVRHVSWFAGGELSKLELPNVDGSVQPAGRVPLGPEVAALVGKTAASLESLGDPGLAETVREAYRPERSYGEAFAQLFARLFAASGLVLIDPLDAELHRVATPIYRKTLESRDALNAKLLQRDKELENAGYAPQVKVTSASSLLFYMDENGRQAIVPSNGGYKAGEQFRAAAEWIRAAEESPERFSPNALLRPVVQDFLFPTVALIAGPAEISYFAQAEMVYREVLGRMPVVLPRAGFTLVDAKAAKLLQKYGVAVEDVWSGSQSLRKRIEGAAVPLALAENFERDRAQIESLLARLRTDIAKLDPTLDGAVQTAQDKIAYQLENLKLKVGRAINEKTGLLDQHQNYLESLLYPNKALQSRELCLLPFLAKSPGLMERLQSHSSSSKLGHHFVVQIG